MKHELPDECESTLEHALVHLNSALDDPTDDDQVEHDLGLAIKIIENIMEEKAR